MVSIVVTTALSGLLLFKFSKKFRFIARFVLLHFTILSSSLTLILASAIFRTDNYFLSKIFNRIAKILLPIRFEGIRLEAPLKPVVYVSNHQSTLDLYYLSRLIPPKTVIIAKDSLKYVPVLGLCMYLTDTIFINRGNKTLAIDSMRRVAEIMKKDCKSVLIFVEGTRSHTMNKEMLPFKKGAFRLALENGFDIVPLVCAGQFPVYSERKMIFEDGVIPYKVLEPIKTKGMEMEELMELTRKMMEEALSGMESKLLK